MSLRTSFILMVLFLGLGYFAFFEPLRTQEKEEASKDQESHVVWLKGKKLQSIEIFGQSPARMVCSRPDKACPFDGMGDWSLEKPVQDGADPAAVGTLASSLMNLTHNGKIDFETVPDEKEFGLDRPQAHVSLIVSGEQNPLILKFGKESAVGPNLYLSVSNDPKHLYLVPNYLPGMINKEGFHWLNKRFFPKLDGTAVKAISWKSRKLGEVRAVKTGEDWRLEKPKMISANKIMMEGLASTLAFASAKSLLASQKTNEIAKKSMRGLPELEIRFESEEGRTHYLKLFTRVSSPNGPREFVAETDGQPSAYVVDAATYDRFQKDLLEYRQRTVLTDDLRAKVDELSLKFPRDKHQLTLKMKNGNWTHEAGDIVPGRLEPNRVAGFLDSLREADFKAIYPVSGADKEVKAFRSQVPDLELELRGQGKSLFRGKFLVFERKAALTEAEGDIGALGEALLKYLPVRLADLTEVANQTVVTQPAKGASDGHDNRSESHQH